MAVYKVPQDVEADDKLLGPFSFRQFIYLLIVAMAIGMGYVLAQIFVGLVVIVIPIIVFFGALALPLKKDQPMETYLGAIVSFYFIKPRKRLWQPDGLTALVEITAPKTAEPELTKDISEEEAIERLDYLSDIVESRGWSVRGAGVSPQGVAPHTARSTYDDDMLDDSNLNSQRFDQMLDTRDQQGIATLRSNFQQQMAAPPPAAPPQLQYNPYPPIQQSVVQPLSAQQQITPLPPPTETQNTSVNTLSPDIIKLANESEGLTVASVAEQAHRIEEKEHGLPDGEVEISLH